MTPVHEFAPAKINLGLKVGLVDAKGYHPLESLVVFADFGDRLTFALAPELGLNITGPFGSALETGNDNLVLRAAHALMAASASKKGAHITVHKALPVSSGIGGGSADAAATLRGLNRLWNCGKTHSQLEVLGRSLGADVPVCVQSRTRFMRGYGEYLEDVSGWPELDAVLVNPGLAVSTKQVFSRFDALGLGETLDGASVVPPKSVKEALEQCAGYNNALTTPVCAEVPVIAELLDELAHAPHTRLARLCGSGATCVALAECAQNAARLALAVQSTHHNYWVQAVKLGGSSVLSSPGLNPG